MGKDKLITKISQETCQCDTCVRACRQKPGWFSPGEIEGLAKAMKISVKKLFKKYLAVDWWVGCKGLSETFTISPAVRFNETGTEFPLSAGGTCVFFKAGKCEIHDKGKPWECQHYSHDHEIVDLHMLAAKNWVGHQKQITKLLGRSPKAVQ